MTTYALFRGGSDGRVVVGDKLSTLDEATNRYAVRSGNG